MGAWLLISRLKFWIKRKFFNLEKMLTYKSCHNTYHESSTDTRCWSENHALSQNELVLITSIKHSGSQTKLSHENGVPVNYLWVVERWREVAWFCRYVWFHWLDEMKKASTAKDPQLDQMVFTWFVKEMQAGHPNGCAVLSIQAQWLPVFYMLIIQVIFLYPKW